MNGTTACGGRPERRGESVEVGTIHEMGRALRWERQAHHLSGQLDGAAR